MNSAAEMAYMLSTKYAMYERPVNGLRNVILDSFMPKYFSNLIKQDSYLNEDVFPKTFAAISEFTADLMGVPLIPREELFRLVGYDKKTIKALLKAVSAKNIKLCMIGLGGTNMNTLYWLNEMSTLTNTYNIFKDLTIFENDNVEYHNLLRFPFSPMREYRTVTPNSIERIELEPFIEDAVIESITGQNIMNRKTISSTPLKEINENGIEFSSAIPVSKIRYIKYKMFNEAIPADLINTNPNLETIYKLAMFKKEYLKLVRNNPKLFKKYFNPTQRASWAYDLFSNRHIGYSLDNYVFYGAPDIATRQAMYRDNVPLITATHGNDDCSIDINPYQDSSFQVESYGMIKLTAFFMNQIRMTIGLLELLASDQDLTESKKILDYSYERDATPLRTERQWHLQLEHSGNMEEQ